MSDVEEPLAGITGVELGRSAAGLILADPGARTPAPALVQHNAVLRTSAIKETSYAK